MASKCTFNKIWTESEINDLFNYLKNNRDELEKPSAKVFYKNFLKEHPINVEWTLVLYKVNNLKNAYIKAKSWETSTGAGSFEGESVKDILLKMCPNFDDLDDIFGSKKTAFQPITMDTENRGDVFSNDVMSPTISEDFDFPLRPDTPENLNVTVRSAASEDFPTTSSGNTASNSHKGIYSRTAVSDILKVHTEIASIKKQKLEFETERIQKEFLFREKELLIKEQEMELKVKEFESREKFQLLEFQLKKKVALKELELKEKIALKELENKKNC